MKKTINLVLVLITTSCGINAQSASEVLKKYTENTGGKKQWEKVNSMEVTGKVKIIAQNMELPFLRIRKADGRQYTSLSINGMSYISTAFDGEVVWGSNSEMKLVKKDSTEIERVLLEKKEFPYTTFNWEKKGFKAEYIGKETINDVETFKIKLIKDSIYVNGIKTENINFLYIDVNKYQLILTESIVQEGVNKGKVMRAYMSDYREVEGYWYPFYSELKYDEESSQIFLTEEVKINSSIDDNIFTMPITNN